MIAYKAMEDCTAAESEDPNTNSKHSVMTHMLIEKCMKTYKCHRSAIDTDLKFCQELEKDVGKEGVKFFTEVLNKMNSFR